MPVREAFGARNERSISAMSTDPRMQDLTRAWFEHSYGYEYSYHFSWMGLPIIQYPQDIVALQEIVWAIEPDLIIETGIARGGSMVLYASLLELIGADGMVLGVDIDLRGSNRAAVEAHPMSHRIRMIEGSSVDPSVLRRIEAEVDARNRVLVVLDSNHTHDHVLRELQLYSPFVSAGSYLIVFDTMIELMPLGTYENRPWGRGNNPWTAVREFLSSTDRFTVDEAITNKLLITAAPGGYLRRVS